MTSPWSSQCNMSEHQDVQADAMALDIDGDIILLAGARHIAVGRLKDAADSLVKIQRNQKYHTTVVEWNPTEISKDICAITTNERVEQMVVREGGLSSLASLKHHTRQVTDLSWHRFDSHHLTTASGDCTTLIWDTRDPRRPVLTLTAVSSVNHVRCNKLSSHLIATAHDGDIRIWDERKGTMPVQYISAHAQKIHGIDWSETHENQLASCSQDCSVRLFDVTKPKRADSIMQITAPLWRARYTPWGEGLVTAIIPSSSGESSLLLWNVSSHSGPVHTFGGSLDIVLELQWKQEGDEYQLVTLSRDQSLRIWRIEPSLQRLCSYIQGDNRADCESDLRPTSDIADAEMAASTAPEAALPALEILASSFEDLTTIQADSDNLSLEDEVNCLSIPSVFVDTVDISNRSLVIRVVVNSHKIKILINFPPSYPYNAAPSFEIEESTLMDPLLKTKILKVLKQSAQQSVRRNLTCLESCLHQLVSSLELTQVEERTPARVVLGSSPARVADAASVYSSFHDAYIPYPRSSGARFCSVGILVCFCRPLRVSARTDSVTPRSLSAATTLSFGGSFGGSYPRYPGVGSSQDASGTDLGFFLPERQMLNRALSRQTRVTKLPRTVSVHDLSRLFFVHKELAEKYKLDLTDIGGTCLKNATVAAAVGRQDLIQVWTLASLAASDVIENARPWSLHPFSTAQIDHMIQHYAKISDIQTAAMLSCMFPESIKTLDLPKSSALKTPGRRLLKGSSPYHTIHPAEGSRMTVFKKNRSNSWSESAEEGSFLIIEHREIMSDIRPRLAYKSRLREEVKRRYGDMLHMWGFLDARAQVLKLLDDPVSQLTAQEFKVACQFCYAEYMKSGIRPSLCQHFVLRCSYCHVLVKGASVVCMACSHGGHAGHMTAWFATESVCPTGCGCMCASETNQSLDT